MYGTYCRLNVHVWAKNGEVIRAASRKIAAEHRHSLEKREERKKFYRIMLQHHKEAQELCLEFRL